MTIPAFILVAAAYVPGTRIKRAVGHPMVLGVKVWAVAHLLANGAVADLVLFGSILVWAVFNYAAARRRDRAAGTVYAIGPVSRDVRAVVIGASRVGSICVLAARGADRTAAVWLILG